MADRPHDAGSKVEGAEMIDDLEVVQKGTLNKMLAMQIRIETLEAALREIADASSTFGVATYANYYAIAKRALNEPMSEPEARIAINNARKALEGKNETIG